MVATGMSRWRKKYDAHSCGQGLFMITPAIEYKQRSGLRCAFHATCGRLQSVQVVRENDNTSRTFLDNEMEQKCDVPAGIHDAGTKFW